MFETHLQREIAHSRCGEKTSEVLYEGQGGDGLVVQLGKLQRVNCHKHRLLQVLSARQTTS